VNSRIKQLESVLLVLWIGGIWTVGYIVAPVLFTTLTDRSLAALVAGRLFNLMGVIGMSCGVLLLSILIANGYRRSWQFWVLVMMLVITAVGYFYLSPAIDTMRQSGEAAHASQAFKQLHGTASILYLCTSLGGLALVVVGLPRRRN